MSHTTSRQVLRLAMPLIQGITAVKLERGDVHSSPLIPKLRICDHVKGIPCHHGMGRPQVANGEDGL
jgi:hypothetical protein